MKLLERRFKKVRKLIYISGAPRLSAVMGMGITTNNTIEQRIAEAQANTRLYTVITDQFTELGFGDKFRREDDGTWLILKSRGMDTATSEVNSNLSYFQAQAESYVPLDEEKDAPVIDPTPPPPIEPPDEPEPEPRPDPIEIRLHFTEFKKHPLGGYDYFHYFGYKFMGWIDGLNLVTLSPITQPNDRPIELGATIRLEVSKAWYETTWDASLVNGEYITPLKTHTPTYEENNSTVLNP